VLARGATSFAAAVGAVAAFALARSEWAGVVTSFLLGFLVPATLLYPLRRVRE
jgi:hypothetical protein